MVRLSVFLVVGLVLIKSGSSLPLDEDVVHFPGAAEDDSSLTFEERLQLEAEKRRQEEGEEGAADLSVALDECNIFENSLPHINPETGETECFAITTQGPCQEGEWFVLAQEPDEEGRAVGECKTQECPGEEEVFFDGQCQGLESVSLCPNGMELLINPFGEGQCDCVLGFIPFMNDDGELMCYQEFLQGPCEVGEQLIESKDEFIRGDDTNDMGTQCVPHFCQDDLQIRWEDGQCLDSVECDGNSMVTLNKETGELICDALVVRQLLIIPEQCPEGSSLNHAGECKEEVQFGRGGSSRVTRRLTTRNRGLQDFLSQRFGAGRK